MSPGQKETGPTTGPAHKSATTPNYPPDISTLISSVEAGAYTPSPQSSGSVLILAHPSTDPYTSLRSLRVFARLGLRRGGLWWVLALEAHPDFLSEAESDYLGAYWLEWIRGSNPFKKRGPHVAA